jgi:hypothetical protein
MISRCFQNFPGKSQVSLCINVTKSNALTINGTIAFSGTSTYFEGPAHLKNYQFLALFWSLFQAKFFKIGQVCTLNVTANSPQIFRFFRFLIKYYYYNRVIFETYFSYFIYFQQQIYLIRFISWEM